MWPWLVLAGLGAFHGLNPAMGWLFAVARGLQARSRSALLESMAPIAVGHALSIAAVVAAVGVLRTFIQLRNLQIGAAGALIAFGTYRLFARHRGRVGMQVGAGQLVIWSFLMATAHGAGLMLIPVLLRMPTGGVHEDAQSTHAAIGGQEAIVGLGHDHIHAHSAQMAALGDSSGTALAAVGLHTLAMLITAAVVAVVVYEWFGLAFLRRGWINFDLVWVAALIGAGGFLLAEAW